MLKLEATPEMKHTTDDGPMARATFLQNWRSSRLQHFQRSSSIPTIHKKSRKDLICLLKHDYQPFKGLGKNGGGRLEPVIPDHHPRTEQGWDS